ncbi:MAG TPA: cysteine desulfurase [Spirochaetota bacterium]|nr:cysteine desulfurase [Spirochaetota bacterium]
MIDVTQIRKDFPYLANQVNGKKRIYLDSAATTQKPLQVLQTINDIYSNYNAPVNRSASSAGNIASSLYMQAHENAARFINAASYKEIIFTKNSTEAVNLVSYSLINSKEKTVGLVFGDEIILPVSEHHSDFLPWTGLAESAGITIKYTSITPAGEVIPEEIMNAITKKTKLVLCSHVSNVLGIINPVKEIASIAHDAGALFLVDATQTVPHMPVNVKDIGCDFLVFSGHKMLGPAGTGVLYGKESLLEKMSPFIRGGGMVKTAGKGSALWSDLPWKFEAGTPDMCSAVALTGAVDKSSGKNFYGAMDYLSKLGMKNVHSYEQYLCKYALERLCAINEITLYGDDSPGNRCGIISMNIIKNRETIDPHIIAEFLADDGIEVRAGGHCAYPLMDELGVTGTLRVSFYIYNTTDEIDVFIDSIKDIITNRLL